MPPLKRPSLAFERALWQRGFTRVAGLDEAGRGAWAGPVVAAAVVLPPGPALPELARVNDSKQLSPETRAELYDVIREKALAYGVGQASHREIDTLNILQATRLAMHRALAGLSVPPDFLLLDALTLPAWTGPQRGIIHGDARALSIAAASILAKVTRDRLMGDLDAQYAGYHFAAHKGYGTPEHVAALARLGPLEIHRRTFGPVGRLWGLAAAENELPAPKRIVAQGYDHIHGAYLKMIEWMDPRVRRAYANALLERLPAGARVLELGCGAGLPVTRALAARLSVVGLDLSTEQLRRARQNVPAADLVRGDLAHAPFPAESMEAVAAFYVLTHVPRAEHAAALAEIYRLLRPGGLLVAAMGARDLPDKVTLDWLGAPMFFSHFDGDTNVALVRAAGMEILSAADETEQEYDHTVTFRWIVARKPI